MKFVFNRKVYNDLYDRKDKVMYILLISYERIHRGTLCKILHLLDRLDTVGSVSHAIFTCIKQGTVLEFVYKNYLKYQTLQLSPKGFEYITELVAKKQTLLMKENDGNGEM